MIHMICTTTAPCPITGEPVHAWTMACDASIMDVDITIHNMTWNSEEVTCPKCIAVMFPKEME